MVACIRLSGLAPESPRTLLEQRFQSLTLTRMNSRPQKKMEILNRVQDDGGATACAASLRSDRFGSDSTNDKQLSLASRVSHSGPDPESPRSFWQTSNPRRSQSSIATTGNGHRPRTIHHEIVGIRGTRPTIPHPAHFTHSSHQTKALHLNAYRHSSLFTLHSSLKFQRNFAHA